MTKQEKEFIRAYVALKQSYGDVSEKDAPILAYHCSKHMEHTEWEVLPWIESYCAFYECRKENENVLKKLIRRFKS
jgi:hypothetical protein